MIPPCDPDALPNTPGNEPDCIPAGDPGPGPGLPCEAGFPGCGPAGDDPSGDDPVLSTLPVNDDPAGPTVLAQTGSRAPNLFGAAGLLFVAAGAAVIVTRRRHAA